MPRGNCAMRKPIASAAIACGLLLAGMAAAGAQTTQDAFGVWQNPENGSHVEMYKCGEGLCAKIIRVTDGQKTDDKNPDAHKRKQPILGLVIMSGAKRASANSWSGLFYNRADGAVYKGTITVKSKRTLDLAGCK